MSPLQTIVHPTDFSESSSHALQLAAALAREHGVRLVMLHAAETPAASAEGAKRHRQLLDERIASLQARRPDLTVQGQVVEGHAVESILKATAELPGDLIVMGSHGRTGLGRVLLGSVAERVARSAPCPVLIVKGPHSLTPSPRASSAEPAESPVTNASYSTIIVPTDFSERSRAALEVATALAAKGTRVIVLYVAGPVHIASEGYFEALEERLREFTITKPGVEVDYVLGEGDPAEEIIHAARQADDPMIVMPSHGRTGLDRLFMGSVAEKVLRGASCPVLILRRAAGSGSHPRRTPAGTPAPRS